MERLITGSLYRRITTSPVDEEPKRRCGQSAVSLEIDGRSTERTDAAIRNDLSRAAETTRGSKRGHLENDAVAHLQVTLKVGFRRKGA
jgi:flavin-binding protein dodecin